MPETTPILLDDRYLNYAPKDFLSWMEGLGVPVHLSSGDAHIISGDLSQTIYVEVKEPLDICICFTETGRLVQQLRAARKEGCSLYVVIVQGMVMTRDRLVGQRKYVEGRWQTIPISLPRKRSTDPEHNVEYRSLDNFLNTLSLLEGVIIKRSQDDRETAQILLDYWHWFQKGLSDHTSTTQFYTPAFLPSAEIPLVRRMAKELSGIGIDKSRAVADHFGSAYEMAVADEREWQKVEGIGRTLARRAYEEIRRLWKEG